MAQAAPQLSRSQPRAGDHRTDHHRGGIDHDCRLFAFTFTTDRTIKTIGLGMASAIVIDALVVRTVLVPAIMHTLHKANWYLPRWIDRRLPHLDLEDNDKVSRQSDAETDLPELAVHG